MGKDLDISAGDTVVKAAVSDKSVEEVATKKKFLSPWLIGTGLLGLLAAYSHFFGLSYRKSYLATIGFENAPVTLGADESLYYAVEGSTGGILNLIRMISADLFILEPALIAGFAFAVVPLLVRLISISPFPAFKVRSFVSSISSSTRSALVAAIIGFVTGWVAIIGLIIYLIVGMSIIWLIMSLGMLAGQSEGKKLISEPICQSREIEKRTLGCRRLLTSDGEELVGLRVHSHNDVQYVLTNSGAYDVSAEGEVLSYRPIHELEKAETESKGAE
ncbi:hypothetical protein ACRRS0_10610 [Agarivorans sp. QJM3NY_29]|uniref:hypothetical protein n=1 Tax=unclassified Agarivorans TaxID=2636026 RepID=UPI003D7CDDFB